MSLGLVLAPMAPVLLAPATAFAVTPDEVLADAGLEARARSISKVLRCPVCQSEDIDESNAQVAHDLRMLVRERLVAGDSDQQVIDYIVARYGEYVLFDPPARGANLILWYAGPGMAVVGALIALAFIRRRRLAAEAPLEALDAAEEKRLAEILRD